MADLVGRLETSRATVVRDLRYLRDFFGAPVTYEREANGYRYDLRAEAFELPGFWLNESELYALLASARLLEQVQPGILTPYLGPLLARVRDILSRAGHPAEAVVSRVRIVPAARRRTHPERFAAVAQAVLEPRPLDLEYHGRTRGDATRRRVHPQCLLHYRDNWYLLAWCEAARELRVFSLDRIRHARPAAPPFAPVPEADLDAYLDASFGIFSGAPTARAVLRFSAERARWVADEVWHPEQCGRWVDGAYELTVPFSDPRELLLDILKYGPDVEVLEPEDLRRRVGDLHRVAAALYREK